MKRIYKIIITIGLVVCGLLLGAKWFLKEAFGPKHRTVEIEIGDKTIVGEETYNADFAAVFYDVKFTLKGDNKDVKLGRATFSEEDWDKNLKLFEVGDWILFPVNEGAYSKLLLTNTNRDINKDTIFSLLELRDDSIWQSKNTEIPAYIYTGKSKIDTVDENRIYVTFHYRVGINEPFKFYNQTVEYKLDLEGGSLMTETVFERKETIANNKK